jgi:hypothetical protein
MSDVAVKNFLKQPNSLQEPLRNKIEILVPKRTKVEHFWSNMPEWFCNNCSTFEAFFD